MFVSKSKLKTDYTLIHRHNVTIEVYRHLVVFGESAGNAYTVIEVGRRNISAVSLASD